MLGCGDLNQYLAAWQMMANAASHAPPGHTPSLLRKRPARSVNVIPAKRDVFNLRLISLPMFHSHLQTAN